MTVFVENVYFHYKKNSLFYSQHSNRPSLDCSVSDKYHMIIEKKWKTITYLPTILILASDSVVTIEKDLKFI